MLSTRRTESYLKGGGVSFISRHGDRVAQYSHRAISRDEARYPDAENVMPERFVNAQGTLTDGRC